MKESKKLDIKIQAVLTLMKGLKISEAREILYQVSRKLLETKY